MVTSKCSRLLVAQAAFKLPTKLSQTSMPVCHRFTCRSSLLILIHSRHYLHFYSFIAHPNDGSQAQSCGSCAAS